MKLTLYYADSSGEKLQKEEDTVRYNSNESKERVVVEQNLTIIPQDQLENTMIKEGDQLEILCFVGGG